MQRALLAQDSIRWFRPQAQFACFAFAISLVIPLQQGCLISHAPDLARTGFVDSVGDNSWILVPGSHGNARVVVGINTCTISYLLLSRLLAPIPSSPFLLQSLLQSFLSTIIVVVILFRQFRSHGRQHQNCPFFVNYIRRARLRDSCAAVISPGPHFFGVCTTSTATVILKRVQRSHHHTHEISNVRCERHCSAATRSFDRRGEARSWSSRYSLQKTSRASRTTQVDPRSWRKWNCVKVTQRRRWESGPMSLPRRRRVGCCYTT
jgi:hypothetical protein